MYVITVTPTVSGIDPGFHREHTAPVSSEPERSFADYLATLTQTRTDHHEAEGRKTGSTTGRDQNTEARVVQNEAPVDEKRAGKKSSSENLSTENRAEETLLEEELAEDKRASEKRAGENKTARTDETRENDGTNGETRVVRENPPSSIVDKRATGDDGDLENGDASRTADVTVKDAGVKPDREATAQASAEAQANAQATASGASRAEPAPRTAANDKTELPEKKNLSLEDGEDDASAVAAAMAAEQGERVPDSARSGSRSGQQLHPATGRTGQGPEKPRGPVKGDGKVERASRGQNVKGSGPRERAAAEETTVREIVVNLSEESRSGEEQNGTGESRDVSVRFDPGTPEGQTRLPTLSMPDATQNLARRLNGSLGDNIVRQAQVIMKDAQQGEIRLVIRPPELGRVRILLQMEHGHIAGRILVDNQNVRQVIEQNLASLQRAFQEAGLEMGDLEVSTGDARQETGSDSRHGDDAGERRRIENGSDQFGKSVKTRTEYDYGNRRINLVA